MGSGKEPFRSPGPQAQGLPDKTMSKGSSFQQGISFGFRLGIEMLVATMVGALIGYGLDKLFGTDPWLLILFLLFGGAAGCLNVYRAAMLVQQGEVENDDDDNKSDNDDHETSNDHPQSDRKL